MRIAEIQRDEAPRLDYRLIGTQCDALVAELYAPPSGIRGPRFVRIVKSLLLNVWKALGLLSPLKERILLYSTGETWGLPIAALSTLIRRRLVHVVYAHRLYSPFWVLFLRIFGSILQVDGWICVTAYQGTLLRHSLRANRAAVDVISQGVDTCFFEPGKAAISSGGGYILAVGSEMRNYALLFDAVRELDSQVIVKPSSAWMRGARRRPPLLPDNVLVLEKHLSYAELRDLYAGASLVVVPLHDTPQAAGITTILEAMAMRKCVVATRSRGLPDALVNGETGVIVEPTVQALQQAILHCLNNPSYAARLATNACWLVRSEYTLEHHAERVCAFLEMIRASAS